MFLLSININLMEGDELFPLYYTKDKEKALKKKEEFELWMKNDVNKFFLTSPIDTNQLLEFVITEPLPINLAPIIKINPELIFLIRAYEVKICEIEELKNEN